MNNNGELGCLVVIAFLMAFFLLPAANPSVIVHADNMACNDQGTLDRFIPKGCKQFAPYASTKFNLNRSTNTCAYVVTSWDTGTSVIKDGFVLAFVDADNWQCVSTEYVRGYKFVKQFGSLNGELSDSLEDSEVARPLSAPTVNHYPIERADGIVGTTKHYWRRSLDILSRSGKK